MVRGDDHIVQQYLRLVAYWLSQGKPQNKLVRSKHHGASADLRVAWGSEMPGVVEHHNLLLTEVGRGMGWQWKFLQCKIEQKYDNYVHVSLIA